MPSPFPGMNPYIEHPSVWHDFHEAFMPAARDALAAQVRPRYIVKIDEQVYMHEVGGPRRRLLGRGDVIVSGSHTGGRVASSVALDAPIEVEVPQIDPDGLFGARRSNGR